MSASGCTMLTSHLKIWIIVFHVQNSRKWHALGKSKSVLELAIPLKKNLVPSINVGPGAVCNLLFWGFFEENVEK